MRVSDEYNKPLQPGRAQDRAARADPCYCHAPSEGTVATHTDRQTNKHNKKCAGGLQSEMLLYALQSMQLVSMYLQRGTVIAVAHFNQAGQRRTRQLTHLQTHTDTHKR